jgi:methyl-accepting chemotaxis protein
MQAVLLAAVTFLSVLTLILGGVIMAKIDDIKTELADIKDSQAQAATAAADLSDDVDKLLALVQQNPTDLTDVEALVKEIQATAKAQADALTAAAGKFPPPTV